MFCYIILLIQQILEMLKYLMIFQLKLEQDILTNYYYYFVIHFFLFLVSGSFVNTNMKLFVNSQIPCLETDLRLFI